jgi:CheY-like chemotaxis protein
MSAEEHAERPRILLVDDEEALVWSVTNRLAKLRPDYQVVPMTEGRAALRELEGGHFDLLVTDIRMPTMTGLELIISARRVHRTLPVIVMTAYPTADLRMDAALRGSIEYLEKPFEMGRFVGLVDEALERRKVGFSGAISVQTLPDIVQLYALSNATGALHVLRRGVEGRIWFEHGAITHAATGVLTGESAFHTIVLWSGGEFSMAPGETSAERSISAGWTELLMESCRRIDDLRRGVDLTGPVSTPGWNVGPVRGQEIIEIEHTEHVVVDMLFGDADGSIVAHTPHPVTVAHTPHPVIEDRNMATAKESLAKLDNLDGFIGAALVDSESGMLLAQEGGNPQFNIEVAGAANTEVVRAKRRAIKNLGLKDEIEDILISLGKQYHLIRPLRSKGTLFFYVALDRSRANLAMARLTLADVERDLQV